MVVLASGDFKLGADAPPEERTDVDALAEWGRRGACVAVGQHQRRGERPHAGRRHGGARAASFERNADASSSPASRPPASSAWPTWPRSSAGAGLIGRRMADNADVAMGLGLLRVPPSALVAPAAAAAAAPASLALLVAGSQGEPLSALSQSVGEHRDVAVDRATPSSSPPARSPATSVPCRA